MSGTPSESNATRHAAVAAARPPGPPGSTAAHSDAGLYSPPSRRLAPPRDPEPFDWYQRYSGIKEILGTYLQKTDHLLMSGCGNSRALPPPSARS